jgi:hypothetical protein
MALHHFRELNQLPRILIRHRRPGNAKCKYQRWQDETTFHDNSIHTPDVSGPAARLFASAGPLASHFLLATIVNDYFQLVYA